MKKCQWKRAIGHFSLFSVSFFSFLHDDDDRRKVHQAQDSSAVHASLYLGKIELEVRAQP